MPMALDNFWLWTLNEAVTKEIWWYSWFGLFFLVSLLWFFKKIRKDLVPVFSDEKGKVHITPHALQELVSKSCIEIQEIHSPSTNIIFEGDQIRLKVRIQVKIDCNIQEARKKLKEKLEHILIDNLCFSKFGGVDLIVKGFKTNE